MSAIFGILRFDDGEVKARDLERMGYALAHRGPDGRKFAADGPIGLGHCLMRVNDEDLFEAQPLYDREADLTLVADCRIDNREELADALGLAAADIGEIPDSAFILRAYKKWGEDAATHLIGDFAFAVWDGRAEKLVLSRDHMGQRAVHYHRGKDFFAFATEIKGLMTLPDVPRKMSEAYVAKALLATAQATAGLTLYEDVWGLPGGTTLTARPDGRVSSGYYWRPHAAPAHLDRDEGYYIETYRQVVNAAVTCRLRRLLQPSALCFSGGFDSGAIAALAGPTVTSQGRKLIAVASVLPEGNPAPSARRAVELFRKAMPHLDIRTYERGSDNVLTGLERSFLVCENMGGNNYTQNGLCRLASAAGARQIMDGHGGDYTVNPRGYGALARLFAKGHFARLVREVRAYAVRTKRPLWRILIGEVVLMALPLWMAGGVNFLRRGFVSVLGMRVVAPDLLERLTQDGDFDLAQLRGMPVDQIEMRATSLKILQRQQGQGAAGLSVLAASHGLEHTRPFHDKRVVEFGLAVPEDLYMARGRKRYLAGMALKDDYPAGFDRLHGTDGGPDPDHGAMIDSIRPQLLAEAERMRSNPELAAYVDFAKIIELLKRHPGSRDSLTMRRLTHASHGLVVARFIQWVKGSNA